MSGKSSNFARLIRNLMNYMKKILCSILVWVLKHSKNARLNRYLEKKIAQLDGGFYYSPLIRSLYKELHGLTIGYGSYGGCWNNSSLWWSNIIIGNYCSFAVNVTLFPADHPLNIFTTHPIAYDTYAGGANVQRYFSDMGVVSLKIGHGVWFGNNTIVLSGCKNIGNGAIIGAGSVVTHDVPPYAIVVGNPAKILRYRLSPEQIERVEASQWWLLDKDQINDRIEDLLKLTE